MRTHIEDAVNETSREGYQPLKSKRGAPPQGGSGVPRKESSVSQSLVVTRERYEELVEIEAAAKWLKLIRGRRLATAKELCEAIDGLVVKINVVRFAMSSSWGKSPNDRKRKTKPTLKQLDGG